MHCSFKHESEGLNNTGPSIHKTSTIIPGYVTDRLGTIHPKNLTVLCHSLYPFKHLTLLQRVVLVL